MKRLHGPFDPVPKKGSQRSIFRRDVADKAEAGECGCGICESRRDRGEKPHKVPPSDERLWARLPDPRKDYEPKMQQKVWPCRKPKVRV